MAKVPLSTTPYEPPKDMWNVASGSYIEFPWAIVAMNKSSDGLLLTLADGSTAMLNDGTFTKRH